MTDDSHVEFTIKTKEKVNESKKKMLSEYLDIVAGRVGLKLTKTKKDE